MREKTQPGTREARKWFIDKVNNQRLKNRKKQPKNKLLRDPEVRTIYHARPEIGQMYQYRYDPKWKNKLPFWDALPLTIPVHYYKDGFLGLNLHYVTPTARKELLDALTRYAVGEHYRRRFQISYMILRSSMRSNLIAPCIKRYLYSHVRTRFQMIHHTEWKYAIRLPTRLIQFRGASAQTVWRRGGR